MNKQEKKERKRKSIELMERKRPYKTGIPSSLSLVRKTRSREIVDFYILYNVSIK